MARERIEKDDGRNEERKRRERKSSPEKKTAVMKV